MVLLRLGIDEFCRDYESSLQPGRWSIEEALGIDRRAAEAAAVRGNELLWQGHWQEAIPFLERALARYAFHRMALNDMAFICATHFPSDPRGLEYARRVYYNTYRGDPSECSILDTAGWVAYRCSHNLTLPEDLFRKALALVSPGTDGYVSIVYHLMAVLKDAEKIDEFRAFWQNIVRMKPINALDQESFAAARELVHDPPVP